MIRIRYSKPALVQSPESVTPPPSAPAIKINVSLAIKRLMNLENAAHRASLTNCASMPTPMCRDHTVWCPGEIRPLVGWFDDPLRSCSRATQRAHIQYSSPRCRFVGVLLNVRVLAQTHLHAIALVGWEGTRRPRRHLLHQLQIPPVIPPAKRFLIWPWRKA